MKKMLDTIEAIIPLIQMYPLWIKGAITIWVLFTAFMIVLLIFGRLDQPIKRVVDERSTSKQQEADIHNSEGATIYQAGRDIVVTKKVVKEQRETPPLFFKTIGIENINFIYNTQPWNFLIDPHGEDMMNPVNPADVRSGIVAHFPSEGDHPRIPEGYLYVTFTVENHSDALVLVDSILLNIVANHPMPSTARYNVYKPVLEPEQDAVAITDSENSYRIFRSKTYKYAPNEVDKFRLKVTVEESMEPQIFEFQLSLDYRVEDKKFTLQSDRHYFISSHSGPDDEQHEAKANEMSLALDAALSHSPPFSECVDAIRKGALKEAKGCISMRIERLDKSRQARMTMFDGDPNIVDCLTLRFFLHLALHKPAEAKADVAFMTQVLGVSDAEVLARNTDNLLQELRETTDGGKGILLHMANQMMQMSQDGGSTAPERADLKEAVADKLPNNHVESDK